ncbi:MAG TPA: ATP-binding protein [Bauldia sp.]|nr:ATP-binding protein [Bauldia sp.]
MRRNSLSFRLIAAASLWSAAALLAAGVILATLYTRTVERAFDERLSVYLRTLVGSLAQQSPPASADPGNLGEPRFELTYSGWYWQVREPGGGPVVLASRSLFTDTLDLSRATGTGDLDGMTTGALVGPDDQSLRVLARTVDFDSAHRYEVLVAGDAGEVGDQIAAFRWSVGLTLAALGVGLVIATTAQIRWGLRPLDNVRRGLAALRSGKETRFEGPFPAEIEPLAKELNALLESNQEIIERARTQVGNLAHALKTPLSVITNEARGARGPLADKVAEQAELMRTQVNHYLERARIAARSKVIGAVTEVEPVVASIVRAMVRIHDERGLSIGSDVAKGALFRGEKQDLEEIVGNLVDNACKWANSKVAVTVSYVPPADEETPGKLTLTIDDDGPGLTEIERREATRRGRRLDETKPGSGLGLSIVTELVGLYEGLFNLDRSPLGGLRAEVELPAA